MRSMEGMSIVVSCELSVVRKSVSRFAFQVSRQKAFHVSSFTFDEKTQTPAAHVAKRETFKHETGSYGPAHRHAPVLRMLFQFADGFQSEMEDRCGQSCISTALTKDVHKVIR